MNPFAMKHPNLRGNSLSKAFLPLAILLLGLSALPAFAGPPFVTDDPDPVEYQHWEYYSSVQLAHDHGGWSGALPAMELNYGAVPNLQLHVQVALAFDAPTGESTHFGFGDTEVGIKYRFLKETSYLPEVAIFPVLELPTGNRALGFATREVDAFLPIWAQKTIGKWTTYGGGGYWINPGAGNRNWWMVGWLIQRQITEHFAFGTEIFHEWPQEVGGPSDTIVNAGGIWDLNEHFHLLFSAGHSIQGPSSTIVYAGFQITFGPKSEAAPK